MTGKGKEQSGEKEGKAGYRLSQRGNEKKGSLRSTKREKKVQAGCESRLGNDRESWEASKSPRAIATAFTNRSFTKLGSGCPVMWKKPLAVPTKFTVSVPNGALRDFGPLPS